LYNTRIGDRLLQREARAGTSSTTFTTLETWIDVPVFATHATLWLFAPDPSVYVYSNREELAANSGKLVGD